MKASRYFLLFLYAIMFPLGLQVSFLIKRCFNATIVPLIDRTSSYHALLPIYSILVGIIAGLFLIFMLVFSKKIASLFQLGMMLPIGIVSFNILVGISTFTFIVTSFAYYYNKYSTRIFYLVICILLVFLIADNVMDRHKKNNNMSE